MSYIIYVILGISVIILGISLTHFIMWINKKDDTTTITSPSLSPSPSPTPSVGKCYINNGIENVEFYNKYNLNNPTIYDIEDCMWYGEDLNACWHDVDGTVQCVNDSYTVTYTSDDGQYSVDKTYENYGNWALTEKWQNPIDELIDSNRGLVSVTGTCGDVNNPYKRDVTITLNYSGTNYSIVVDPKNNNSDCSNIIYGNYGSDVPNSSAGVYKCLMDISNCSGLGWYEYSENKYYSKEMNSSELNSLMKAKDCCGLTKTDLDGNSIGVCGLNQKSCDLDNESANDYSNVLTDTQCTDECIKCWYDSSGNGTGSNCSS